MNTDKIRIFIGKIHKKLSSHFLSDEIYLKQQFYFRTGKRLNLENPQTLNEKLQWLKLYDRKPEYTNMVDKHAVKKYVADIIGEEYTIPTLGVWNHFDEIDFDKLPNQFVLKCTHDSGGLVIVRDKARFDKKKAKKKLERSLKKNYYYDGREWPYKNVMPRIIAEPFLHNKNNTAIVDYKFYCFGGNPIYFMYSLGEAEHNVKNHKFDINLNSIDNLFKKVPSIKKENIELPPNIDKMLELVKMFSKITEHIRVDFYNIDGRIYFGELTFYSGSGFLNIDSHEYSQYLANLINLSSIG